MTSITQGGPTDEQKALQKWLDGEDGYTDEVGSPYWDRPPSNRSLKIVVLSDCHGFLPPIPPCDILLVAGDMCPYYGGHGTLTQQTWFEETFGPWWRYAPADFKILIGGNHDFITQEQDSYVHEWALRFEGDGRGQYLMEETTHAFGIKIHGYPWVPNLQGWAWYANDWKLDEVSSQIPRDTEILMTHGPAFGLGDMLHGMRTSHVGDEHLRNIVTRMPVLKLHVSGHIHEARGRYKLPGRQTEFLNVAHLDRDYCKVFPLVVIERTPKGEYIIKEGYDA